MLSQLFLRNFAIADDLLIDFESGLTAITGETGAGKSIALDALQLCLGARSDSQVVRTGADKADITASFHLGALPHVQNWLQERELDADGECFIRRTITAEGRSKAYINGTPTTAAALKELGGMLISMHSQHDHQALLQIDRHIYLYDQFLNISSPLHAVQHAWKQLQQRQQQAKQLEDSHLEQQARRQLIDYQLEELLAHNLIEGEFATLVEQHKKLTGVHDLHHYIDQATRVLYEQEEGNAYTLLGIGTQALEDASELDVSLHNVTESLQTASVHIEEAVRELHSYASRLEADPEALQQLDQRMSQLHQLARKHAIQPDQLHQLQVDLQQELQDFQSAQEQLEQLQLLITEAQQEYTQAAKTLSLLRQQGAQSFNQEMEQLMHQLNMPDAHFVTRIEPTKATVLGTDKVTFLASTNLGQQVHSIHKAASGGELSRIGLAIQALTADKDAIPTLIFDEVDVGVSGPTALTVGRLLQRISHERQVICVTHLPQVAAQAEHQIHVYKHNEDGRTKTKMTALQGDTRLTELARLLGGDTITKATLANAKELLQTSTKN